MLIALITTTAAQAADYTLNVVDGNGQPVTGFRWMMQQDTTWNVDPNNPPALADQLVMNFHKSYHPLGIKQGVAAGQPLKGYEDTDAVTISQVPPGRYYVSILPYSGYAMGGGPVTVLPNADDPQNTKDSLTVVVEPHPIPTAQISVFLFHDCYPLNGAADLPEEEPTSNACTDQATGLPYEKPDFTKFNVVVEEPAGKYGANGGPMLQDAFGNPLGTVYVGQNPDTPLMGTDGSGNACPARADGTCADGTLTPNADGTLIIKNVAPGKYGIIITPQAGWTQTATIEGTPVNDAWVKANEPPFMVEFGLPGPHTFFGFTKEINYLSDGASPATISGMITDMHMSRPPATSLFSGRPFPQCWVAINENNAAPGLTRYAMPCNADSTFSISNVPPGSYELKVFDTPLDVVIATMTFTVDPAGTCNGGQSCAFGEVPVFNWFNRLTTYIFNDTNQNGFWDATETNAGAETGPVNVRWRDGTVYQSFPTDFDGVAPFDESFPWFNWMVAEVGFTNKKATGLTAVADAGGPVDKTTADMFPAFGELNPQEQCATPTFDPVTGACLDPAINPNTGDNLSRTEVGPVLTQAFQGFLGQTNVIQFGKIDYTNLDFSALPPTYVGENGGISGVVFNTVTRAENDPQFAVGEGWEPGVPRVQVNLYADGDIDAPVIFEVAPFIPGDPCSLNTSFPCGKGDVDWNQDGILQADDNVIDDVNANGIVEHADVDNAPLGWAEGGAKGAEDVDHNGNGVFDLGDAIAVAWTDSWDDNLPTDCQGQNSLTDLGIADTRCFDGMRSWNQVRPGVFDGGYAFSAYDMDSLAVSNPAAAAKIQAFYNDVRSVATPNDPNFATLGDKLPTEWLIPGDYIVEATTPTGYSTLREHHKNVDFGDEFQPALQALPPTCIGDAQPVPPYMAILTKDGSGEEAMLIDPANIGNPDAMSPFAGDTRPVCDVKKVGLAGAQNAAADFFLVSDVPIAANVTGVILNDLANEFNPNSPNFGEKYGPPLVPVAFYDWNGKEVNRVYSDEYGAYNALVPSTWNANLPQPSGMSPNMLTACMNDSGPIPDPQNPGQMMVDPYFNSAFSQFCYTFQYMPGSTTYLDTPVVPVAAFATPVSYPVDCAVPERTPMIRNVQNTTRGIGPVGTPGDNIRITSLGVEQVLNPDWDGVNPATRFINRNRNFGNAFAGTLELEDADGNRTVVPTSSWSATTIDAAIPALPAGDYQVVVTRAAGVPTPVESETGVTLTIGVDNGTLMGVRENGQNYAIIHVPLQYPTINAAIDAADAGDMVLVAPGVYDELVIMHKPVKLQGWGAGSVTINARQTPTEKVMAWRTRIEELTDGDLTNGEISLLPGQAAGAGGVFQALGAPTFPTEEGAGIFVAGLDTTTPNNQGGLNRFNIRRNRGARIDGFTIVGASQGGGIVVNGYAPWMNIGNNVITTNSGFYGGGIRVGHPNLTVEMTDNQGNNFLANTDAVNDRIRIHHNMVTKNGGSDGAGGGISLFTGADQYRVQNNWVCGNYSQGNGGGIAHVGVSNGGRIEHNDVIFNESFSQANAVNGGGIYIGGKIALVAGGLSEGTGNVVVDGNRIHGNLAGAGDGGGIAIVSASGTDIVNSRQGNSSNYRNNRWWDVSLFNNMITNNVSALAGALTIQDAVEVHVVNNTIAHNESTATAALAFTPGFPNQSNAQPAGIVSRLHSPALADLLASMSTSSLPLNGGINRLDEYLTFSDANFINNIVFANRSFFWLNYDDPNTTVIETGLFPANCTTAPTGCNLANANAFSNDMAVLDGVVESGDTMFALNTLLTDNADNTAEYTGRQNVFTADAVFANSVFNEGKNGVNIGEFTVLQTAGAFDEGGNFIQVAFGPLSLVETGTNPLLRVFYDYHLAAGSPAISAGRNVGTTGPLGVDIDGDPRNNGNTNEIGADELP
ncbi:MAG: hypothetical protein P8045_08170 [Candidatus Thiodiazotropha sp.]